MAGAGAGATRSKWRSLVIASRLPVLILAALSLSLRLTADTAPLVHAPAGAIRGTAVGKIHVFKGIPYALPPTGPHALETARRRRQWTGTRDATQFGLACVQPKPQPDSIYAWDCRPMSEDCLSLNIWAPAGARKAPVFFWIHGGALLGRHGQRRAVRRRQARGARRRRRLHQLSPRRARLSRASRVERRVAAATSPATTACSIRSRRCAG